MTYQKKLESLILMGSDLRILLSSSHISPGEVQSILRSKGIYSPSSDKRDTVPLLSSTLLTPEEFTRLVEMSVSRESVPKHKVATISLSRTKSDWMTSLQRGLPTKLQLLNDSAESYEITSMPSLKSEKDRIVVDYAISRKDFSKDWLQRELSFEGSVEISAKGDDLILQIGSVHSSKETDKINQHLISLIAGTLHEEGLVSSTEVERITFSSFTNTERVKFFKYLSAGYGGVLETGNIDNVEIYLDPDKPNLPPDAQISWMKDIVQSLRIGGDKLNDVFLLQNETFYDYFSVRTMDIDFPFKSGTSQGTCRISFFFAKPSKPELLGSCEFTIEHARPHFDANPNENARRDVLKDIQVTTRAMVDTLFMSVRGQS